MTTLPDFPIEGGCACGAVRYRLDAPPIALIECHCADCQKVTGSAFSLGMPVMRDDVVFTKGALQTWSRTADSGNVIAQYICGVCGTRLYSAPEGAPTLTLRGGTLDDTSWLKPAAAIWTDRAQPSQSFDHVTLAYAKGPADFTDILKAWRSSIGM